MKSRFHRAIIFFLAVCLSACAGFTQATPTQLPTAQPTAVPPTPSAVAAATPAITPTAVAAVGTAANPLRVRLIVSDTSSAAPLTAQISAAAAQAGISVTVATTTADAAYALAQDAATAAQTDAYIGTDYDVAQLALSAAVAAGTVSPPPGALPYIAQSVALHTDRAVYPFAGKNYLISIANHDLLAQMPASTDEWFQIDPNTTGRTKYDVAYAWAEGRWFDAFVATLEPPAADPATPPSAETLTNALTELQALRRLGPRDVTSYQEATIDFVNWRVPYTLDTDAAIRRYDAYSQTMTLDYAAPPLVSLSGAPLAPAVDVVSLIGAAAQQPGAAAVVTQLATALQSAPVQRSLVETLHYLPLAAATYASIDITQHADVPVLATVVATSRAQAYTPALICRWDAYELVLPGVLLRETRIPDAVEALTTAIQACRTP